MPGKNDAWGIEVGQNAIKAMHLVADGDEVLVEDFEVIRFKRILTTPDIDVEEAIQMGLDQLLTKHDISKSNVVVSVPGDMAFARFAKLPPVEPKKIPEIVKFEAVQQIPFPIEEVEWDYQVFASEDSPDVEVGIFAILKSRCAGFLEDFHGAGMGLDGLTLSPLAVFNAMVYDKELTEDDTGTVIVDIGTTSTDVIIVDGNGVWLRTVNMGGNDFTDALVSAFKLSYPKAEKLKREARTSKYARQIYQAMRPVFSDFVQELQRSIGYYQSLNRDVDLEKLIGVGSTFKLPGLQKYLMQQLNLEVKKLSKFSRLNFEDDKGEDFADYTVNMATAYGLALQGLGLERIGANILPKAEIKKKLWKAKQPWFAAAAAIMLLATLVSGFRVYSDAGKQDDAMRQYENQIQAIERNANDRINELESVKSRGIDPRVKIENIERLLDYRDVMPKLAHDLDLIAKTMQWQPELLDADYAKMMEVPRAERRRIYIKKISLEYVFTGDADTPNSDLWKTQGAGGDDDSGGRSSRSRRSSSKKDEGGDPHPPQFKITMTGSTPNADATKFLSDSLVAWLNNPERYQWGDGEGEAYDRPYEILVSANTIVKMKKIEPEPETKTRSNSPFGGGMMEGGMIPPMMMGGGGKRSRTGVFGDLLPKRPTEEEGHVGDSEFTIEWMIQIKEPQKARIQLEKKKADPQAAAKQNAADKEVQS